MWEFLLGYFVVGLICFVACLYAINRATKKPPELGMILFTFIITIVFLPFFLVYIIWEEIKKPRH